MVEVFPMKAPDIIRKAADLVGGERNEQHGDIAQGFALTATLWTDYLGDEILAAAEITPSMVADMLELLKISRRRTGAFSLDNYVDGAGYAGIAGELAAPAKMSLREQIVQDAFKRIYQHSPLPKTRDEAGPLDAFERSWTGGELRREVGDGGAIKIRDLATNQIVFELD